jgi:hypothetical protein
MDLMQDDLSKVAQAVSLGRRTVRVIQANIAFALAVKTLFLILVLTGYTSLVFSDSRGYRSDVVGHCQRATTAQERAFNLTNIAECVCLTPSINPLVGLS